MKNDIGHFEESRSSSQISDGQVCHLLFTNREAGFRDPGLRWASLYSRGRSGMHSVQWWRDVVPSHSHFLNVFFHRLARLVRLRYPQPKWPCRSSYNHGSLREPQVIYSFTPRPLWLRVSQERQINTSVRRNNFLELKPQMGGACLHLSILVMGLL